MDIYTWLQNHWVQIGVGWILIQNLLKAVQDAIDAEPPELKTKPLARVSYYMTAVGGYLFAGNRIQAITKTGG